MVGGNCAPGEVTHVVLPGQVTRIEEDAVLLSLPQQTAGLRWAQGLEDPPGLDRRAPFARPSGEGSGEGPQGRRFAFAVPSAEHVDQDAWPIMGNEVLGIADPPSDFVTAVGHGGNDGIERRALVRGENAHHVLKQRCPGLAEGNECRSPAPEQPAGSLAAGLL